MLTDSQIKKIKPTIGKKAPDRYNDGNNLYLHVFESGGKRWIMDYRFEGKRKTYSIGTYPDISLAEARIKRDEAKKLLRSGIDPTQARKQQQEKDSGQDTFEFIAKEWISRQTDKSESTQNKNVRLLQFAINSFGSKQIDQITPVMVLQVCRKEEEKGYLEQAQRIKSKCSQVFRYAVAIGKLERDPTTDLRGALKTPQTTHRAAITDINLIPKLLHDIDNYSGELNTVCALKLAVLVFVRPIELRSALWADIDFDAAEWKYIPPKTQNQTKLSHIVPLSKQAIAILRELHQFNGHTPYVFYSSKAIKHGIMSENTVNDALRTMGYTGEEMCGHGFRALAKTTLKERLKFSDECTELQLAHKIKTIHGRAYDRTAFIDERKAMMQVWADYLDGLRTGEIIQFPRIAG
ncbi:MAG: integrase arm-type DNA-binding domain-containing protein [Gammaproteobacteria bacterium]|nr:integrase arm-type DNA-binding domain-containing protein [Gammaproteobacteria bacterium]